MHNKYFFIIILALYCSGCVNKAPKPAPGQAVQTTPKDSATAAAPQPGFAGIEFASKMDLACGMLLTAGIQDTALYKGKIYGFCSTDCKTDFLKTPEAFLASKYRH